MSWLLLALEARRWRRSVETDNPRRRRDEVNEATNHDVIWSRLEQGSTKEKLMIIF